MRVFLNPGHDRERDSGAVNPVSGLRECDVAAGIGELVKGYLETAGCEVQLLQSDNLAGETPELPCVVDTANGWPADIFVSADQKWMNFVIICKYFKNLLGIY